MDNTLKPMSYTGQMQGSSCGEIAKSTRIMCVHRGFDQRSDQTKDYAIYIGTWRKRIKAKTS
jgi:hypothetical protein